MTSRRRPLGRVVWSLAAVILLALASSACIPMRVYEVPDLRGRLTRGGQPIAGAEVRWAQVRRSGAGSEDDTLAVVSTDAGGYFRMEPSKRLTVGLPLPLHSLSEFTLSVMASGREVPLWRSWDYVAGPVHAPSSALVQCDLLKSPPCRLLDSDDPWLLAGKQSPLPNSR